MLLSKEAIGFRLLLFLQEGTPQPYSVRDFIKNEAEIKNGKQKEG